MSGPLKRWGSAAVLVIAGALSYSYFANRLPPIPQRALRIGFEPNPPFQIRTGSGFGGLAVEIVREAARRSGLRLEWIETGTSTDEAFQKGLVDLWPLMADLPERRRRIYLSKPWAVSTHILFLPEQSPMPDRHFSGSLAMFKIPIQRKLAAREFPQAQQVPLAGAQEVLAQVCTGAVAIGLLETRVAMIALKDKPRECEGVPVRMRPIPDLTLDNSVASTFEAAGAAARLRREIGYMFRDGTMALTMAKYSFYGLDDAWSTYDLLESAERTKWFSWGSAVLAAALFVACWQSLTLRQRNRTERALRESEERFRAIFQQAGVGVAQLSLGGRVEMANDRYCEVVGHSRHELVGKGTSEITHRPDLKEEAVMLSRLLSGELQTFSTEKRYTREDGSFVWAQLYKSLVRDENGKPKCFITVVEDITERKLAEAALKESEERFRNMADSAPVLIWVSGTDKLWTFFNRGWLDFTGRTMEQELGGGWAAGVHPEDVESCIATYVTAFDLRESFKMEYRLRRADGEYRWILDHGLPRLSPRGEFAGYIGSCMDITDLKRNYEQHLATQKFESLGVLAAGVAHDFNNLLGVIVARADSARSELDAGSPVAEDVHHIRLTALRAAEIVSQLMIFAGQETAPSTANNLSAVVVEMLDLLKVSIGKTAVLTTDLAPGLPPVPASAPEIRQIVMNLILNAAEALEGKPGSITITTAVAHVDTHPDPAVRLDVRDTGSGMTADVRGRIFDPFFTTRFAGRGLGLSAVQGIVRRRGGSIEVQTTPGAGSQFTVILPSTTVGVPPRPPAAEPESAPAKSANAVLLVEDEDALRSVVAKILRKKQFEVLEAANGAAAIDLLKTDQGRIGIVLLDVTLPGISGAELYDELRRIDSEMKVVLTTAYSSETAMREFNGRDIWAFIRKPYRTEELVEVLRKAAIQTDTN